MGTPASRNRRDVRKDNHGRFARPHRWLVEDPFPLQMIYLRGLALAPGLQTHGQRVAHRNSTHYFALDNTFRFIDGMTRGEQLFSGRVATWMDGVETGYSVKTADPSTALRFGRDDKGRAVTLRKDSDSDG